MGHNSKTTPKTSQWTDEEIDELIQELEITKKNLQELRCMKDLHKETLKELKTLQEENYSLKIQVKREHSVRRGLENTLNLTVARIFRVIDDNIPQEDIKKHLLYTVKASHIIRFDS